MLFPRLGTVAFAAAAVLVNSVLAAEEDNPRGQSTFVSPDDKVAFALTVPDHDNEDIYFAMRMANDVSWAGIGLGSHDMPGALFLIIYQNDEGDNVTFSPRLSNSHMEPSHFDEVEYEVLNGTRVDDDYSYFYARCIKRCRNWPAQGTSGGYIDVSSQNAAAVYAVGPQGEYRSDSPSAALKFHTRFGSFSMDMQRTQGSADPPVLTEDSANSGVELLYHRERQWYWIATMHGVFMVIAYVGLFPAGAMMLNILQKPKWHGITQSVGFVLVIVGFPLGIVSSYMYQRSRRFNHYHQILGIVVTVAVAAQLSLGILHHRQWLKTKSPTIFGMVHIWLGRIILFLGIMNGFFGYTFALHRRYGAILAGVLIFVFVGSIIIMFTQRHLARKRRGPANQPINNGYQHPPQAHGIMSPHQASPSFNAPPYHSPTGAATPYSPGQSAIYEADSTPINLQPLSPWRGPPVKDDYDDSVFDKPTKPREFT